MKISVIVTCYNVEEYVEKTITSILANKVDLELILVNDGSSDNTFSIIKPYQEKYPTLIKVLNQENQGLSMARNNALQFVSGDYVSFIDGDDYVSETCFLEVVNKLKVYDYDVVCFDCLMLYPEKQHYVSSGVNQDILIKEEIKKIYKTIYPTAWNKIYKYAIIKDLKFLKNRYYEDVDYCYKMLEKVESIGVINKALYYYVQRKSSISNNYDDKLNDLVLNMNDLLKHYQDIEKEQEYFQELQYVYVRYLYATYINKMCKTRNLKKVLKAYKYAKKNVRNNIGNYEQNTYFKDLKGFYLKHLNILIVYALYLIQKIRNDDFL